MPRPASDPAKAKGIYRRGEYWLDWDARADGTLRSPYLTIFWYDPARKRVRSASTAQTEVEQGKNALDAHYLQHSRGIAVCPTCHQPIAGAGRGFLLSSAMDNYLTLVETRTSNKAIQARLAHVDAYLDTLPSDDVKCEDVTTEWVEHFRRWALKQPIVGPQGKTRQRAPSTVEASVVQLAAAINAAHKRGDTRLPAQFSPIQAREINRTPQHRSDIKELAAMFRYCVNPEPEEDETPEGRKRMIEGRAALHRFLKFSVATLCRPDAAHEFSTDKALGQWNAARRVISLNPKGRRQTKKYRATVIAPRQIVADLNATKGSYVVVNSVRRAWENMAKELKLPEDGEAGTKLIRRSMAQLVRERRVPAEEVELQLGHRKIDSISDLYAPFQPGYLEHAVAAIEGIIDEIEKLTPGAFHRSDTGDDGKVVSIRRAKNG